jgi:hypothetical protein
MLSNRFKQKDSNPLQTRMDPEVVKSRSITPPNKKKLKNFFFQKGQKAKGADNLNKNHLNFYKKTANKSYGAIKQLDISYTSNMQDRNDRFGGKSSRNRVDTQRRDIGFINSRSVSNEPIRIAGKNKLESHTPDRFVPTQKAFNPLTNARSYMQQKNSANDSYPTVIDMTQKKLYSSNL